MNSILFMTLRLEREEQDCCFSFGETDLRLLHIDLLFGERCLFPSPTRISEQSIAIWICEDLN